jgi:DNA-binding GntR family transcriptional regulator
LYISSNKEVVKLDIIFHSILFEASKNSQLSSLLDRILCHYLRFLLSFTRNINRNSFFHQAFEIMKAIEDKDEDRLHAAGVEHNKVSLDKNIGRS